MKKRLDNFAFRATLVYVIFAGIWILASDWFLGVLISDPRLMTQIATLKGWFFVAVTACILYAQLHREWKLITRQQAEIRNSEQQLKLIINHSPSTIFVQDLDLRYISVINPPLKLDETFFLGHTDAELFSKDQAELLSTLKGEVFKTRQGSSGTGYLHLLDQYGYYEWNIDPHYDFSGQMDGVIGYVRDLTEHKRIEDELYHLNLELEERVETRTAELQSAMSELESFSYSVSHDLRAPLRAINGMGKILLEDYATQLDEEGVAYIERMQHASRRMNQLIEALLQLSRVTRTELRRVDINLSRMALDVINDLFSTRNDITWKITADMCLSADPTLMRIVLVNLLGNAYKFTGQKQDAEIELGFEIHEDETVYFVRDNGVGFDMKSAGKLFSPFQRLTNVSDFEGTGIGLAMVQRIILRHGGRIWADAALEEGATFYFCVG